MKADSQLVWMIVCFVLGAAFILIVEEYSLLPYIDSLFVAFSTLVAAFLGAWYAFALNAKRVLSQELQRQADAGNKAIFDLIRTYSQFRVVREQFIDEHRDKAGRHLFIMPMASDLKYDGIDYDSISFLLNSDDPDLLRRLAMFEQEVLSAMGVIKQRSFFHHDVVQPVVEDVHNEVGPEVRVDQVESALGARKSQEIVLLTDYMVSGVDAVLTMSRDLVAELRSSLKKSFPGHAFLDMR